MYHMFCIDGGLDIKVCIFEWMIKWINAVPVIGFNHTTHRKYLFTQMSLSERIWEPSYNSPMPTLCSLYGMLLASLLHRMPRIWSLSWLWRPVAARRGAFSTLCSIFSQWYHLLFILSSLHSASGVCRMTCCLRKYSTACVYMSIVSVVNVCMEGRFGIGWVLFLTDRNIHQEVHTKT